MRRREFIAGLGSAAAWPVVVRAQQPALPVVGFLSFVTAEEERVTRGYRRLQELTTANRPIWDYPLPEVRARKQVDDSTPDG